MRSRPLRRPPTTDMLIKRIKGLLNRELDEIEAMFDAGEAKRAAAPGPLQAPRAALRYPRRREG